ncbi:hypothetical protein D3C72_1105160 [compost metagenome]
MGAFGGSAQRLAGNGRCAQLQYAVVPGRVLFGIGFSGVDNGYKAQQGGRQGQRERAQGKTETGDKRVRHGDPFASNRSVVEVLLRG